MNIKKGLTSLGVVLLFLGNFYTANAGELYRYQAEIDWNTSLACISLGDAVSCSLPLLNEMDGLAQGTTDGAGGYVIASNQGVLQHHLISVEGTGGGANNGTIVPSPVVAEDGFKTNVGNDDYVATGYADGSTGDARDGDGVDGDLNGMDLGNMLEPTNNSLDTLDGAFKADIDGTWEIGIQWLIDALTYDETRLELMLGFDFNQAQADTVSLDIWSLITVRDTGDTGVTGTDGSTALADINYEIKQYDPFGSTPTWDTFTTDKTYYTKPDGNTYIYDDEGNLIGKVPGGDFDTVTGLICYNATPPSGMSPVYNLPYGNNGACADTYGPGYVDVRNSQGDSKTEFGVFLPELNAMLETYLEDGYDVISGRMLFGCFNDGTDISDTNVGIGYLADGTGETKDCGSGGFPDVYILAAGPDTPQVPEPSSIALLGLGLLGFGFYRKQR